MRANFVAFPLVLLCLATLLALSLPADSTSLAGSLLPGEQQVEEDLRAAFDRLWADAGGCSWHANVPVVYRLDVVPNSNGRYAVEVSYLSAAERSPVGGLDRSTLLLDVYQLLETVYGSSHSAAIETVLLDGWVPPTGRTESAGPTLVLRGELTRAAASKINWKSVAPDQLWARLEGAWLSPELP